MSMIGLGRRVSKDPRDREYLIPRRRAQASSIIHRSWRSPGVFDQGATSQCVAYSGVKWLITSPIINKPLDFVSLYNECQRNDEWPGEDYEGTSVRGLFKVLKNMGLVSEYRWAFDCETIVNHVLTTGPVVMGTEWPASMANADKYGYVHYEPGGQDGHAWCLIGANRKRRNPDKTIGAARGINSWGDAWAQRGRFWISFSDLDKLIKADGEAAIGIEVRR